jgi:1,4-dihydroxy-2-naphthoate octaprenyltransferase
VLGARPRTLPAAIVPVLVGTAAAWGAVGGWTRSAVGNSATLHTAPGGLNWLNFLLALVVSLALQIATNYANDYSDGKRGTDDPTQRVGPPRLVGNGLATAAEVKRAMLAAFAVAAIAGTLLAARVGWELILFGIAAIAAGYFYTGGSNPYGYLGLGEVFVFVFFGLVATVGSAYVQLHEITWLAVGCGVACGSLSTALLVVNNLRDIPGDTVAGKKTLAVRMGDARTRKFFVVLVVLPFVLLPLIAGLGGRFVAATAFGALAFGYRPMLAVLSGAKGRDLIAVLGDTARLQLVFGLMLSGGLIASQYI